MSLNMHLSRVHINDPFNKLLYFFVKLLQNSSEFFRINNP